MMLRTKLKIINSKLLIMERDKGLGANLDGANSDQGFDSQNYSGSGDSNQDSRDDSGTLSRDLDTSFGDSDDENEDEKETQTD